MASARPSPSSAWMPSRKSPTSTSASTTVSVMSSVSASGPVDRLGTATGVKARASIHAQSAAHPGRILTYADAGRRQQSAYSGAFSEPTCARVEVLGAVFNSHLCDRPSRTITRRSRRCDEMSDPGADLRQSGV